MHRSIGKKNKLLFYLILFVLLSTQVTRNQINFSIKIKNIEVTGLSYKNNLKVKESLNSLLYKNIFFTNKIDFQYILKKNNLIEKFYIKKMYPNLLKINIKQTDFLAVTIQNKKKFYIGSNGKLISFDEVRKSDKKLPFVFSKSNYHEFSELKKIIDKSEFKFKEIDSFYYFPSNRWDIKTKDGLLIKLPEKNILESLKHVNLIKLDAKFKDNMTIDLRIFNHIITSNE